MYKVSQNDAAEEVQVRPDPEREVVLDGVSLTEPHTEPSSRPWRLRAYVAALLLLPFLYMTACFFVMRSDFFLRRTQNLYLANLGYGLRLRNADCKILIFGDSSAMEGVDPATLEKITGLSACNIGEPAGVLRLNGTMVLDTYLSRNARPEVLVILLSPNDMRPSWLHEGNYEAVLMRVREKPDRGFLLATLQHGEDILSAIGTSGRFVLTWMLHPPLAASIGHERDQTRGRYPDTAKRMEKCMTDSHVNPPSPDWLNGLRQRYSAGGTRVLVDVTPVPACDPSVPIYEHEFSPASGLVDNKLTIYPSDWYTQSGHFHLGSPEGWGHLSTAIGDQIKHLQEAGWSH